MTVRETVHTLNEQSLKSSSDMKEAVYQLLRTMIMKREFTPNERIDAAEIAEKLGISRTPVRDALNMLDAEGFITTVPRKGIYVKGIYKLDLVELFQYREMIELYAIENGFEALTGAADPLVRLLRESEELLRSEPYDGSQMMDLDMKLHKLIVHSANNSKITESYERLNCHVQMARAYYLQDIGRIKSAHEEHKRVIDAIAVGNKEEARRELKVHLDHTLQGLVRMLDLHKVF